MTTSPSHDQRPTMAPWNLGLRFGLEIVALAGLARGSWVIASGPWRWVTAAAIVIVAAAAWAVFNVPGDPSRSGAAPVEVPGTLRLMLELVVLGGGVAGFIAYGPTAIGVVLAVLLALHYAASGPRLRWLLQKRLRGYPAAEGTHQ